MSEPHNHVSAATEVQLPLSTDMVLTAAKEVQTHLDGLNKPYSAGIVGDCILEIERLQAAWKDAEDRADLYANSRPLVTGAAQAVEVTDEINKLRAAVEYWRLAAERREARRELTGLDIPEAQTLDTPHPRLSAGTTEKCNQCVSQMACQQHGCLAHQRCSADYADVDQLALNVVNQIWATPEDWHPTRRKAQAQVLIIDALRRMTGEPQAVAMRECLESIAGSSQEEPREPDDADWRFRCLSMIEAAKNTLSLSRPQLGGK